MPRPKQCRRICEAPYYLNFSPIGINTNYEVKLTVDEYEVIRLVDFEKFTHKECAIQMGVSRTSVTGIYENARYKIADAIINGKILTIGGGNYQICDGRFCGCKHCKHRNLAEITNRPIDKGGNIMKIAITYKDGEVFQHFGHSEQFAIYDVENGEIISKALIDTNGQGHGALAEILGENSIDVLICGGIGKGAQAAITKLGIQLCAGVNGNCDEAVKLYLENKLSFTTDAVCSHHNHDQHQGNHNCESHSCENHCQ